MPLATPRRLLVAGTAVWVMAVAITVVTHDRILVPTVILVGSFLVPVALVLYAVSRARPAGRLPSDVLVLAFFTSGRLGVFSPALTEPSLLPSRTGPSSASG